MSWQQVVGHAPALNRIRKAWQSARMASTWLFAGPDGIGKRTFALQLAKTLLCEKNRGNPFDSCDECAGCLQVVNGGHPDLIRVAKPADKSSIPLELLIGARDRRQEEGLCRSIALKPVRGVGKVAIIDDADDLKQEGANALLKTLEEPPAGTVLILISASVNRQLPTILSRCQVIRFEPMADEEVATVLRGLAEFEPVLPIEELAALGGGNVQMAMLLNDPEVHAFRQQWLERLGTLDPAAAETAKQIVAFAEQAGKESAAKRDRLMMVSNVAIVFFEALLLESCGLGSPADAATNASAQAASSRRQIDPEWISCCIDRTIEFQGHVASNVGLATAVEPWLDDISSSLRGKMVAPVVW
jgi:DNA polymerase-3 subunit delta'